MFYPFSTNNSVSIDKCNQFLCILSSLLTFSNMQKKIIPIDFLLDATFKMKVIGLILIQFVAFHFDVKRIKIHLQVASRQTVRLTQVYNLTKDNEYL